jgi:hypothetical protein
MVVGSDLDAVADVASDLESWGHDPIVHFDTDGLASTITRVRPDVVVVVDDRVSAATTLVGRAGSARIIAYVNGSVVPAAIPSEVRFASNPVALRHLVEGGDELAADDPTAEAVEIDVLGVGASTAMPPVATGGTPAAWVRVLVATAILVVVASLIFAPPSEDVEVADDAPPVSADVAGSGETIDIAALAIPTVAPQALIAVTPATVAGAGRSGFGGVVVLSDGGAPVAGARLVVTGPSGTLETETDADGRWRVANARGGSYSIVATAPELEGAPLQLLIGEGQIINGVRVVLGGGASTPQR